ncbi:MAG: hypothetical protein ACTS73_03415 [Arsenophonus sp. NEOnobi-MAG3]
MATNCSSSKAITFPNIADNTDSGEDPLEICEALEAWIQHDFPFSVFRKPMGDDG